MTSRALTACHECDLLQREPMLPPGGVACCRRCNAVLFRQTPGSLERALAYSLGAAIFLSLPTCFRLSA